MRSAYEIAKKYNSAAASYDSADKKTLALMGVSLRDFLRYFKRVAKILLLFIFCFAKHTTLLAKYSVIHFQKFAHKYLQLDKLEFDD